MINFNFTSALGIEKQIIILLVLLLLDQLLSTVKGGFGMDLLIVWYHGMECQVSLDHIPLSHIGYTAKNFDHSIHVLPFCSLKKLKVIRVIIL